MTRTTIVIPCYNEADRLNQQQFLDYVRLQERTQLLFVNDGSRDGTLDILRELESAEPDRIQVLDQPQNGGKAEAVRCGMLLAAEQATRWEPCFAGFWDADLATPLEAIPEFEDALSNNPTLSVVIGSRIPLLGRRIERKPIRRVLGRVFASVASAVLGLSVYDTQCGAKMFRLSDPIRAVFSRPFLSKWIFDVEILARMTQLGQRGLLPTIETTVAELPLWQWTDVDGSKLKGRDFAKAIGELTRIMTTYRLSSDQSWVPEQVSPFEPAQDEPQLLPTPAAQASQQQTPSRRAA